MIVLTLTQEELRDLVREAVAEAMAGTTGGTRLLTKTDLARELACSVATVDRMTADGMPHVVVGRTRRFDIDACRAWCASRSPKAEQAPSDPTGGVRWLPTRRA
jgi:hypothetical protein